MRTQKEIDLEIKSLEACKAYVPQRNYFRDNNHRNIDLQIEYLKGEIDTTAGEFYEFTDSEQEAISEAELWQEGDQLESPSSGWDSFKPKPNRKKCKPSA